MTLPGMEEATSKDRLGVELARAQTHLVRALRDRRAELNLSAVEVATRMDVDPSFVSRFERGGTNATFATIRRYAKAVDAMVTYQVRSYQEHKTSVVADRAELALQLFELADDAVPRMAKAPTQPVFKQEFAARIFPESSVGP